jgi:molecular chaperone DnaK
VTSFSITARDKKGSAIKVAPAEFSIAFMLPMAAPPLPHTVAIELSTIHGVTTFDPVFQRHCPLPAEVRKTYKAERTLRPSEFETTLPIKFWEIEVSDDPQEKWWAGCVHVRAGQIKRPIVEGSDLELTVKMDASRKMTVELFVPILNQSFADDVYVPDPPTARSQLQQQLDLCFERLDHVRQVIYESDRDDMFERIAQLQERAEEIAEQVTFESRNATGDPDAALVPTGALRKLRMQLTQLEEQLNIGSVTGTLARKMRWQVRHYERIIQTHGTDGEKQEFEKLHAQYEKYGEANDARGLTWVRDQMWNLHQSVVRDQMWYWQNWLAVLKSPGQRFLNTQQAAEVLAEGDAANGQGDMPALRSAVRRVWVLQAPDQMEAAREQAAQSGLRAQ